MNNQCACSKMLRSPKKLIIWLVFLIILLLFLSLTLGSYAEHEPAAGKMFGIIGLVIVIVCGFLARRLTWKN